MDSNDKNEKVQPDKAILLQIIIDKDGNTTPIGPVIGDELACLGLLCKTMFQISKMHEPKIVKPFGGLMKMNGRH